MLVQNAQRTKREEKKRMVFIDRKGKTGGGDPPPL